MIKFILVGIAIMFPIIIINIIFLVIIYLGVSTSLKPSGTWNLYIDLFKFSNWSFNFIEEKND